VADAREALQTMLQMLDEDGIEAPESAGGRLAHFFYCTFLTLA